MKRALKQKERVHQSVLQLLSVHWNACTFSKQKQLSAHIQLEFLNTFVP